MNIEKSIEEGLNSLKDTIVEANRKNGFWELHDRAIEVHEENANKWTQGVLQAYDAQKLCLVHSEVSEALEAMRKSKYSNPSAKGILSQLEEGSGEWIDAFKENVKDTVEDEIADSIIRLLDFCGGHGIDIEFHIKNKLMYNATRGNKHGGKMF